jgi:hypothetical protein
MRWWAKYGPRWMPLYIPVSWRECAMKKLIFNSNCMYSPTTAKWLLVQSAVIPILLSYGSLCVVRIVTSRHALSARRSILRMVFWMRTV